LAASSGPLARPDLGRVEFIAAEARIGCFSPSQLAQSRVANTEVVPDLVDHGAANLLHDLLVTATDSANGTAVDRDPVGQDAGVARRTAGQRNAVVEAEQAHRPSVVFHDDGHVAHEFPELDRYAVERLADHRLESLGFNLDHGVIVCLRT
jgi:hypothetical protein